MLLAAVILNILSAAGIIVMALKYLIGTVPVNYHSEMLKKEGTIPSEIVIAIFTALYRIMGFALIAVGISVVFITLTGVQSDLFAAKLFVLVVGLVVGVPALIVTKNMEQLTGVKTPWRMAAILSGGIIVAFVLAIL